MCILGIHNNNNIMDTGKFNRLYQPICRRRISYEMTPVAVQQHCYYH